MGGGGGSGADVEQVGAGRIVAEWNHLFLSLLNTAEAASFDQAAVEGMDTDAGRALGIVEEHPPLAGTHTEGDGRGAVGHALHCGGGGEGELQAGVGIDAPVAHLFCPDFVGVVDLELGDVEKLIAAGGLFDDVHHLCEAMDVPLSTP